MAISNTNILIKRSGTLGRPSALAAGELGYSYVSNTIFIGSPSGNGVVNVGGQFYTSIIDAATQSNTASTLVKRDTNGAFFGQLYGNANTADTWRTARTIGVSGEATGSVNIDGSSNQNIPVTLTTVNPNVGTFGSTTAIPVVTVGANGRVTAVTTASIATSFDVSDGTTSNTINGGATFFQKGEKGITTTVSANTVTFGTDYTVLRSNTQSVGSQVIQTDLTVTGNLIVTGNIVSTNVATMNISDPLIYLAANNYSSDIVDIGFVGNYFDGSQRHFGVARHAADKQIYIFDNYTPEIDDNNIINISDPSFRLATVHANLTSGIVSGLANAISVLDGGTGRSSFTPGRILVGDGNLIDQIANSTFTVTGTAGQNSTLTSLTVDAYGRTTNATYQVIAGLTVPQGGTGVASFTPGQMVIGNGTGALQQVANVASAGSYGSASYHPVITVDNWGRVTAVTNTAIAIDTSAIVSGILPITRGGTNGSTFTNNQLTYFNGTSIVSLANTSYTATGTGAANNTVTSITVDGFGRTTAATYQAISGLTVGQGGTGVSSFTTNGITYGNGSGAMQVTASAGTSDQSWSNQILTVDNSGVPVWSTAMDGGSF